MPSAGGAREKGPEGIFFTHLDEPLFEGAEATKRDLVEYLDSVSGPILRELEGRALSVVRAHRGQGAFMQKNLPKYAPRWIPTVQVWAEASKRQISYALCNDRRTLLWFANQRAVEYHPSLVRADCPDRMTHIVLDLDPPSEDDFKMAVHAARSVRQALAEVGLQGAVKTSGAKGLHVFVPVVGTPVADAAAATRALAARVEAMSPDLATTAFPKDERGGKVFVDSTRAGAAATLIAAYSPRLRPGTPVSFPLTWGQLDEISPRDFTIRTALRELGGSDPWASEMPAPQALPPKLIEEGHTLPWRPARQGQ